MKVYVKILYGPGFELEIFEHLFVHDVKKMIEVLHNIPARLQVIFFLGKVLPDDRTIGEYPDLKEGSKLNVVHKNPCAFELLLREFLHSIYTTEEVIHICNYLMPNISEDIKTLDLAELEVILQDMIEEESGNPVED